MNKSQDIKKKKVIIAMSGGVDSSVAAALLKERGFSARGVYMKNWVDPEWPCPWQEERRDAMAVSIKLGIPFETWDFSKEYYEAVTQYMVREYAEGRTPNPDVMCNREIKFKVFLERALKEGADYIATGHYVRLRRNDQFPISSARGGSASGGNSQLLQAKDTNKDQSYFLWTLTQNELKHCLFPIGEYTKPEVRKLARKFNLLTAEKKDSQGICFIGELNLKKFLKTKISTHEGKIVTTSGEIVGTHEGVEFFTIGQRHGIGFGGGREPLYVVGKDIKNNILIVGSENSPELYRKEFLISKTSWVSGVIPQASFMVLARARYRASLKKCIVASTKEDGTFKVTLEEAERAITPGQSLVLYQKNAVETELLGGGIILD